MFLAILLVAGNQYARSKGFGRHVVLDYDSPPRDLVWRPLPDQHFWNPDPTWIDINGEGLRDPREIEVPKPPGTYRVLCLGDSFTFGLAVPFEETYPHRLEGLLRARGAEPGSAPVRVEVWNAGVNGYCSCQELAYLHHHGFRLDPDLVTVGFVMNDVIPILEEDLPRRFPGRQWLLRYPLYQWLRSLLLQARLRREGDRPEPSALKQKIRRMQGRIETNPSSSALAAKLWDEALGCLRTLHEECATRNLPVVLIVFPTWSQMRHPSPEPEAQRTLREFARETGMLHVDLLEPFARAGLDALLARDRAHPSGLGNEIAAREIDRILQAAGIPPGS